MNAHSRAARSIQMGLLAVVVVWLSSAVSVPCIGLLKGFTPEQLLVWRSLTTLCAAYLVARGRIWGFDSCTLIASPVLALSSLSFYHAIREWGFYPVMVVITISPIVNVAVAMWSGKKLPGHVSIGLVLVMIGVAIGMQFWKQSVNWVGFRWALVAAITGGILYELWHRSAATAPCNIFWSCLCLFVASGIVSLFQSRPTWGEYGMLKGFSVLVWFGFVGGVVYFSASVYQFKLLPAAASSVLAQGTTPAVIIGACILTGAKVELDQWVGVAISIIGISFVCYWLERSAKMPKPPE